jgi:two-component system sensor histidine kinase YesM
VAIDIRGSREVSDLAFHFREMVGKINQLIAEAVNKQAVTKEAELNALKNQIDAHFLYNTLENIKMLAEVEGQYTISDALTSLSGMMRYSLQWTHDRVPLREEIQHIQNYVAIMRIRYANRIELALNVPDAYLELEVLKMTLQPIVENAVKYGFHPSHRNGVGLNIEVNAHVDGDSLRIEIKDNGTGIPPEALRRLNEGIRRNAETEASPQGGGIGLRNVYQRMAMFYGRDDVLVLRSEEGAGTTVAMTIPYRGGERR